MDEEESTEEKSEDISDSDVNGKDVGNSYIGGGDTQTTAESSDPEASPTSREGSEEQEQSTTNEDEDIYGRYSRGVLHRIEHSGHAVRDDATYYGRQAFSARLHQPASTQQQQQQRPYSTLCDLLAPPRQRRLEVAHVIRLRRRRGGDDSGGFGALRRRWRRLLRCRGPGNGRRTERLRKRDACRQLFQW